MQKAIFLAVQEHLLAAGLGVEHFDWFNHQYEDTDPENRQEGDFAYPAVFIEFQPYQPSSHGRHVQKAEITFRLHLVTISYAHSRAGLPEQSQALEHLDLASQLYAAFQGWSYKDTQGRQVLNTCTRTNVTPDHNQTNQVVNIQDFRTLAFDFAAVPVRQAVQPALVV
jgi:hypothetical protein